jgi:hypothetical protein
MNTLNPYAVCRNLHSNLQLNTQLNTGAALRTGLGVPPTPYWASFDVVVRCDSNPGAVPAKFRVALSLQEVEEAETEAGNECLWREVTALVPFVEWSGLQVFMKDWSTGRQSVSRTVRWRHRARRGNGGHEVDAREVDESEEAARDILWELQEDLVRALAGGHAQWRVEWTLIIDTR